MRLANRLVPNARNNYLGQGGGNFPLFWTYRENRLRMVRYTLVLLTFFLMAPAWAAQKTAVLPFDMRDASQDGEYVPQFKPDDLQRLKLVADELKSLMTKDGRYEVMDLTPYAAEIDKAYPFSKCDGCDLEVGQKAGADLAVMGYVDKLSDALISLQIFVRDVKSGEMVKTMSAEIRGNTDELWLHGIRYLWRNRFAPQEKKN